MANMLSRNENALCLPFVLRLTNLLSALASIALQAMQHCCTKRELGVPPLRYDVPRPAVSPQAMQHGVAPASSQLLQRGEGCAVPFEAAAGCAIVAA